MHAWSRGVLAALAISVSLGLPFAAPRNLQAADAPPAIADSQPAPPLLSPATDDPDRMQTIGAFAGGLLVVCLTTAGLVITFKSLTSDIRGRRRRYHRRVRRDSHGAQA
jgi:hypothetical protein